MGPLGVQETVFIFVLALLVFGPRKLPELGKTIGKAMSEFRRASTELRATFDREMHQIERENESLKEVTSQYAVDDHSYNYDSYHDNGDYSSSGSYDYNTADKTSVSASAPQGADNQADSTDTTAVASHESAAPAETPGDSSSEPRPAGVSDPQSVKS
jgi:TatA/E family protein of Tat protein translocase